MSTQQASYDQQKDAARYAKWFNTMTMEDKYENMEKMRQMSQSMYEATAKAMDQSENAAK